MPDRFRTLRVATKGQKGNFACTRCMQVMHMHVQTDRPENFAIHPHDLQAQTQTDRQTERESMSYSCANLMLFHRSVLPTSHYVEREKLLLLHQNERWRQLNFAHGMQQQERRDHSKNGISLALSLSDSSSCCCSRIGNPTSCACTPVPAFTTSFTNDAGMQIEIRHDVERGEGQRIL